MWPTEQRRFIVVEGPIGVGKTTLARRIAETLDCEPVFEAPEANPFLLRYYENPRDAAFPAQMFFLFQRAQQLAELSHDDLFARGRIADYILDKDRLFAQLTLDANELELYEASYRLLNPRTPRPDLVIYLQAPVEVLQRRIRERARGGEERISADYLKKVNEAYARFFHDYAASPLLIVNASVIDLAHNDDHFQMLMQQIASIRAGRHYFNPLPELM